MLPTATQNRTLRPNILLYLADDQNQWDYGAYGNPQILTPAVDSLASAGVAFTHAFTTMATCAPSRRTLLTGLYPMRNGAIANHYVRAAPVSNHALAGARDPCARGRATASTSWRSPTRRTCPPSWSR